jgi:hypothetical protein
LRDLGYVEGQNIIIDYHWAAGERITSCAGEGLVRLKVDHRGPATPVVQAAKNATATILT